MIIQSEDRPESKGPQSQSGQKKAVQENLKKIFLHGPAEHPERRNTLRIMPGLTLHRYLP
ncbi:MAG: hypothetical protein FWH41_08020 [Treponema sp.]|nr:hypothetical protein [Treponema sp.]